MKRVLLTGARGFIGRYAAEPLLARGCEVHAVTSGSPPPGVPPGVTWHTADLFDPTSADTIVRTTRPTHLLHLAWYTGHGKYWTATENLLWVEASLRLLRAFAAGGRRVVLAGTCAEYDWAHGYCSEGATPTNPATLYGASKHALHQVAAEFARVAGVSLAWGRIFSPYGPGEPQARLVPAILRALLTGGPVRCSSPNLYRDFLFAADCADAFAALLVSPVEGPVNIASGRPVSVDELVRMAAGVVPGGTAVPVEYGSPPPRPGDPPLLVADVRRLTDEVGWRSRTDLRLGLTESAEYWRSSLLS